MVASHEGEHHGDDGRADVKITTPTYLYAFCAALNSCNLGYGKNTMNACLMEAIVRNATTVLVLTVEADLFFVR